MGRAGDERKYPDVVGGGEDKVLLAVRVVPDRRVPQHNDITCRGLMSAGWQMKYNGSETHCFRGVGSELRMRA